MQANRAISARFGIVESRVLGKGSTGSVFLGYELSNPQRRVAVKAINLNQVDNQVTKYLLGCEITALSELGKAEGQSGSENVVRLLQVVSQSEHIYLVTELLEGGTLAQYIKMHPNGLNEDDALTLFGQMLRGYNLIRNKQIIHRDLKPDNILFRARTEHSKATAIIDFGYCEVAEVCNKPQVYYNVGSPKYMAPQAYEDNFYSEKSDMWALGVVLYEMVAGRTLDEGHNIKSYLQMIKNNGITLPNNIGPYVKIILQKLLCYSYEQRYSCPQILEIMSSFQNRKELQRTQQYKVNFQMPQKNIIFRSAFINPYRQARRDVKIHNYQTSPGRAVSPAPILQQKVKDHSNDKQINRYNSAKVMPLFTFKNIPQQQEQSYNVNRNIHISVAGNERNKNVNNAYNTLNRQYFPQKIMHIQSNQGSNINKPKHTNRINFNIVDLRSVSPLAVLRPSKIQQKFTSFNDKNNSFQYYRQQRISTQPQQRHDQNSVTMQAERKKLFQNQYVQQYHNNRIVSLEKNKNYFVMTSPQKDPSVDQSKVRFLSQNKLVGACNLNKGLFSRNSSKIQDNILRVSIVYPDSIPSKERINSKPHSPSFNQSGRKVGFIY